MLARDLARHFPTVDLETDALVAARTLAEQRLPGLIVLDQDGKPYTVLPGSQVLGFVVPSYVQDDPALARAFDEKSSDALCEKLAGRTVRDMLPRKPDRLELPVAAPEDTTVELAAQMVRLRSPIIAIVDEGRLVGGVSVGDLLEHLLGGSGQ